MKHEDRTDRDMSLPPHTQLRFIAKLTYCLPLVLLPALTTDAHAASLSHRKLNTFSPDLAVNTTTRASRGTGPYLAVVRPIGIRFAAPAAPRGAEPIFPPPAPVVETEPEVPSTHTSDTPALENPPELLPAVEQPQTPVEPVRRPLPILPDDTRREIRPEDVLPFFQYPHSDAPPVNVLLPAPVVPSSATYQQRP